MRFVSDTVYVIDDVYITQLFAKVFPSEDLGHVVIEWAANIKPLAVDDALQQAFLPDLTLGPRKRNTYRVNGSFQVRPLPIANGVQLGSSDDAPNWAPVLDLFEAARETFIAAHPDLVSFASKADQAAASEGTGAALVRQVTSQLAAERQHIAARIADNAIARGERGGMSSTVDVLHYLSAFAKGPDAFSKFQASLVPTHDLDMLRESKGNSSTVLVRDHFVGRFEARLSKLDAQDPWALVLSARPDSGETDDPSTLSYLQAAGSADAMTVEWCRPGGADLGVVSVRSVVGRPDPRNESTATVEIVLPAVTLRVSEHEIFSADEAATIFEAFYQSEKIPPRYLLRPVEGFTADGSSQAL